MKAYNVIWIDDNPRDGFEAALEGEHFYLIHDPFKTSSSALDYLEKNHEIIDAIILDANFKKDSEEDYEDLTALHESLRGIRKIEDIHDKQIPRIIYTGVTRLSKSEDELNEAQRNRQKDFKQAVGEDLKVFPKGCDIGQLAEFLREKIGDSPNVKIRSDYPELWAFCEGDDIRHALWTGDILPLLSFLSNKTSQAPNSILNSVRRCLEHIIIRLASVKVIPENFVRNRLNDTDVDLSNSLKFLNGGFSNQRHPNASKTNPFILSEAIIPPILFDYAEFVRRASNSGSHVGAIDRFKEDFPSNNLNRILIEMIVDLIRWTQCYINSNKDTFRNKNLLVNLDNEIKCVGKVEISQHRYTLRVEEPSYLKNTLVRLNGSSLKETELTDLKEGDCIEVMTSWMKGKPHRKPLNFKVI